MPQQTTDERVLTARAELNNRTRIAEQARRAQDRTTDISLRALEFGGRLIELGLFEFGLFAIGGSVTGIAVAFTIQEEAVKCANERVYDAELRLAEIESEHAETRALPANHEVYQDLDLPAGASPEIQVQLGFTTPRVADQGAEASGTSALSLEEFSTLGLDGA